VGRQKGLAHFVRWQAGALELAPGLRVSQLIAPTFDAVFRDVLLPLTLGGTACVPPDRAARLDTARLLTWLEEARVLLVHTVASLFAAWLVWRAPERLPSLQHLLLAGEALRVADVRRWFELFGERVRLTNLYGATETTMVKFFHPVRPADL